jgi:hypothetical protein
MESRPVVGLTQPPTKWVPRANFPRGVELTTHFDLVPTLIKYVWSYTSIPSYVFMVLNYASSLVHHYLPAIMPTMVYIQCEVVCSWTQDCNIQQNTFERMT